MQVATTATIISALLTLLPAFSGSFVWACRDPGINICESGKKNCTVMGDGRWLFSDGREMGMKSDFGHDSLTQGCYCQFSSVWKEDYQTSLEFATALNKIMLVTSCSPDFNRWWDGQYAMTRIGGTFTRTNGRYSPTYQAMYCEATENAYGDIPPSSKNTNIVYIDWPKVSQAVIETPLPSNVQFFNGTSDVCPGYNVESKKNRRVSTTPLQADQVRNCTCYANTIIAIGTTGRASSSNGDTFTTVCDRSYTTYFNGRGLRDVRNGFMEDEMMITDYCGPPRNSQFYVAYVKSNATTKTANNNRQSNGSSRNYDTHLGTLLRNIGLGIGLFFVLMIMLATLSETDWCRRWPWGKA